MRDKLIEILEQADFDFGEHSAECAFENVNSENYYLFIADHLLANGVIVQAHGEWADQYKGKYANALYKCSVCGEAAYGNGKVWFLSKFCPSCGAKMKGANDEQAD